MSAPSDRRARGAARAEWRLFRGWDGPELQQRLVALAPLSVTAGEAMSNGASYHSQAIIAREPPGPPLPDGCFTRARSLVLDYQFSDPRIVRGHFDRQAPLLGRRMLLEIQVWGQRYLCGVVVGAVCDQRHADRSVWGYRYDTLAGHLEAGAEWFLLTKEHATGEIQFRIEARWRKGQFPNWWSRVGFALLARRYQRAWHRLAYLRLRRRLDAHDLPDLPRGAALLQATSSTPQPPIAPLTTRTVPPEIAVDEVIT